MENHRNHEQQQHLRQEQHQHQHQTHAEHCHGTQCHNCGATIRHGAIFCEECGAPQGCNCASCGAAIQPGMAICPICGNPASTRCTFCGSEMSVDEAFCPECGNPRSGIQCPSCGTLNFRSFCRNCNGALNAMALYAVEQAKKDPRYIRASAIAQELQQMEDEMAKLEALIAQESLMPEPEPERVLDTTVEVSEDTRRLLEKFEAMSKDGGSTPKAESAKPKPATSTPVAPVAPMSAAQPRRQFSDAQARLAQLRESHKAKVEEFQREIDAMVPDPNDPPEIQRNFASAHIIKTLSTTTKVVRQRVAWVCNKCQVWHNNPSECSVAEFGGRWVYDDVTVTTETTSTNTVNI